MTQTIKTIIDADLCVGCGACVYACPHNNLTLSFSQEKEMFEPVCRQAHTCDTCTCLHVCPSYAVDYTAMATAVFGTPPTSPLGHVDTVFLAQNTDADVNLSSSSGGVIPAILLHLRSHDICDAVIALSHDKELAYTAKLHRTEEDIRALPGSIYHNVDFSDAIALLHETEGRIALVAIPCQLDGIYAYIHTCAPHLKEKLVFTVGLMCGWTYTYHAIKALCAYKHIEPHALESIAYRGGGPVGKLRITTHDGTTKNVNRRVDLAYAAAFDRSFNLARCHMCVNHGNFLADVVVGDAWLPCTLKTRTGISLVICRTSAATGYVNTLSNENTIVAVDATEDEVIESQTPRVVYGHYSYPYAEFCRQNGLFAPTFTGPNTTKTEPVSDNAIKSFHTRLLAKRRMQNQRQYRRLFWYKYSREFWPFISRYFRWFFVRVLKIKSLLGVRHEIASDRMEIFR